MPEVHGGSVSSPSSVQTGTLITTHRSEYFAGQTEISVAVNAEADTTAGGWAVVDYLLQIAGLGPIGIVSVDRWAP